jgi:hypothetical protein
MPPVYVKPYIKRQKTDMAEVEAAYSSSASGIAPVVGFTR